MISKILVGRKTSEVVENTDELSFGEGQHNFSEDVQQEQQRQTVLTTTVEEFCRNISAALDNPSFETKQEILRLVVERVEFVEDQITIKHVIPVSDVRLRRNQHSDATPITLRTIRYRKISHGCCCRPKKRAHGD